MKVNSAGLICLANWKRKSNEELLFFFYLIEFIIIVILKLTATVANIAMIAKTWYKMNFIFAGIMERQIESLLFCFF